MNYVIFIILIYIALKMYFAYIFRMITETNNHKPHNIELWQTNRLPRARCCGDYI